MSRLRRSCRRIVSTRYRREFVSRSRLAYDLRSALEQIEDVLADFQERAAVVPGRDGHRPRSPSSVSMWVGVGSARSGVLALRRLRRRTGEPYERPELFHRAAKPFESFRVREAPAEAQLKLPILIRSQQPRWQILAQVAVAQEGSNRRKASRSARS